ncbi:MAG: cysteine desulfurase [Deltaproteobacteria bacterium]|nr:cysteine desulfurase [Deltaproteobacteria bacterium]
MDMKEIKKDFPILDQSIRGHRLVYLDSAATTQKPKIVIEAIQRYYETMNANIHRGVYHLSEISTLAYEETRKKVAAFLGAKDARSIVFTRNATEAINLVAQSWGGKHVGEGDEILLTEMEHHSNIVPWQLLAQKKGAILKYVSVQSNGTLDLNSIDSLISERTKIFAFTHVSNVLGTMNPVKALVEKAHERGVLVLVDGAQGAAHLPVDVSDLGCDFYAFSAHKMLGPTGVGGLYGKLDLLEEMPPMLGGGEMILEVHKEYSTWKSSPEKFEAGTPNIADVIAFSKAIDYLKKITMEVVHQHEKELTQYALARLMELEDFTLYGLKDAQHRAGVISFNYANIHPHDLGTLLDHQGIAIRTGHHCAQLLMRTLQVPATARVSFYIYNTKEDVDAFMLALIKAKEYFNRGTRSAR